uniref:Candidate secreted effector n=1 Tax=Meloidogyne incognita TaxID=6306 RepID=A0A914LMR9_MELIC
MLNNRLILLYLSLNLLSLRMHSHRAKKYTSCIVHCSSVCQRSLHRKLLLWLSHSLLLHLVSSLVVRLHLWVKLRLELWSLRNGRIHTSRHWLKMLLSSSTSKRLLRCNIRSCSSKPSLLLIIILIPN